MAEAGSRTQVSPKGILHQTDLSHKHFGLEPVVFEEHFEPVTKI